jgi:truncated hemoglobin YjbI
VNPTPYEQLGGDAGVRRLVERFYALMDSEPEFYGIRKLHPPTLEGSTDKLYLFLSGWMGIRCCAHGTCRSPLAKRNATSGWRA